MFYKKYVGNKEIILLVKHLAQCLVYVLLHTCIHNLLHTVSMSCNKERKFDVVILQGA